MLGVEGIETWRVNIFFFFFIPTSTYIFRDFRKSQKLLFDYLVYSLFKGKSYFRICLMVCVWKAKIFIYHTYGNKKNWGEILMRQIYSIFILTEILKQWFEIEVIKSFYFPKGNTEYAIKLLSTFAWQTM